MSASRPDFIEAHPAVSVEGLLEAPPELAFAIFSEASHLLKWWGRFAGYQPLEISSDVRPGGSYSIRMQDGAGQRYRIWGEYETVEAPSLLVLSWSFQREGQDSTVQRSRVEMHFSPHSAGTALRIEHSLLPSAPQCASVARGWAWQTTLAQRYVAGGCAELADQDAQQLTASELPLRRSIKLELDIAATPQKVYDYLTQADLLTQWFPSRAQTEPREGGAYRFEWDSCEGGEHCKIGRFLACEPGQRVAYSWYPQGYRLDGSPKGPGEDKQPTLVDWRLNGGCAGGTQLSFCHSGWGYGPDWDGQFQGHTEGWEEYVNNLRSVLELGQDQRQPPA